ncbi:MAG TPA: TlpA disulfide reductase family protein [Bacteroidia bacterium]|nr:TlpA disulfide reductase family protein [Bacteroidia bacterium]
MKKYFLSLAIIAFVGSSFTEPQQKTFGKLPSVNVTALDGSVFNTSKISNNGKPIIIDFWATWCKPCKKELDAIAEDYPDWQKETGVKVIAISIDDSRAAAEVAADVNAKGWTYDVYIDENQDFKRAMNVNNVPFTFVLNGNGEIVWKHNSYADGDADKLYEIVKKVAKGEKITE